jgi:hypothetical protein
MVKGLITQLVKRMRLCVRDVYNCCVCREECFLNLCKGNTKNWGTYIFRASFSIYVLKTLRCSLSCHLTISWLKSRWCRTFGFPAVTYCSPEQNHINTELIREILPQFSVQNNLSSRVLAKGNRNVKIYCPIISLFVFNRRVSFQRRYIN